MKFPNDSGPIYLETTQGGFPVEPFNTFSNTIFLLLIIYWSLRVYRNPGQHKFLAWVLPVIGVSYIGGTVYHATRSHEFWLRLDWMPIMLLCASLNKVQVRCMEHFHCLADLADCRKLTASCTMDTTMEQER